MRPGGDHERKPLSFGSPNRFTDGDIALLLLGTLHEQLFKSICDDDGPLIGDKLPPHPVAVSTREKVGVDHLAEPLPTSFCEVKP
ncbi:hypothetical protein AS594_01315 [Streptomyces agglomeratus]|uniref:Uncharacterized protein n=1 Tax=Streptomyces agglomeratus TaxID=285458 RepID=A0A1E5P1F9_9ACTN|nr:hypothetical protein AS594_01315 [Streptomyces agglomeratus]